LLPILEKTKEKLDLTIDEILYHSEAELRKKLLGEDVDIDVKSRQENWAIIVINEEYKIVGGDSDVKKLLEDQGVSR